MCVCGGGGGERGMGLIVFWLIISLALSGSLGLQLFPIHTQYRTEAKTTHTHAYIYTVYTIKQAHDVLHMALIFSNFPD